jgi:hypothetical protein
LLAGFEARFDRTVEVMKDEAVSAAAERRYSLG